MFNLLRFFKGNKNGPSTNVAQLTVTEILFLRYINGKPTENPNIASYWSYSYGISDTNAVIKHLLNTGMLCISDYHFNATKYTVTELKDLLKARNLPVEGNKPDLIQRLLDNLSPHEAENVFNSSYYQLTSKGKAIIYQYPHLIYFHQCRNYMDPYLTLEIVDDLHKANPNLNESDLMLEYHKFKVNECIKDSDIMNSRNYISSVAQIYMHKEDFSNALFYFLKLCYVDMFVVPYNSDEACLELFGRDKRLPTLALGILANISLCAERLDMNNDTLKQVYEKALADWNFKNPFYDKKEIWNLIEQGLQI